MPALRELYRMQGIMVAHSKLRLDIDVRIKHSMEMIVVSLYRSGTPSRRVSKEYYPFELVGEDRGVSASVVMKQLKLLLAGDVTK